MSSSTKKHGSSRQPNSYLPRVQLVSDPESSCASLRRHPSTLKEQPSPNSTSNPLENHSRHAEVASVATHSPYIPIPDRGHGRPPKKGMMDPFEVRIRFTQHLQHLNASVTSANKAAQYALKYRDMDEDLHSCILEQLERNSMNNRANIMYFIEHLCDMASREGHPDYVRMMERDILRVVDAVAPEDGSGAANVKVVRKVLAALQSKSFLMAQTVAELEECLKERDTLPEPTNSSSPTSRDVEMRDAGQTPKVAKSNGFPQQKFDKKQIEQRIEEDRERHKRLRETIWAVPNPGLGTGGITRSMQQVAEDDPEFMKLWEEISDLGDDDIDLYAEENEERRLGARDWRDEHRLRVSGGGE